MHLLRGAGRGREVYWHVIVAAAAQRCREGEEVYWHVIVAAAAQRCRKGRRFISML